MINENMLLGQWHEIKGMIRKKWGKITDDEIEEMAGRTEEILGCLQKHYGITKEQAEKDLQAFLDETNK